MDDFDNYWPLLGHSHTLILDCPTIIFSTISFYQFLSCSKQYFIGGYMLLWLGFKFYCQTFVLGKVSLTYSRLDWTTLSRLQNGSMKREMRKCCFPHWVFFDCGHTVSLKLSLLGALSLFERRMLLYYQRLYILFSEQMLPVMVGCRDQDISLYLSSHPLVYLMSPVATICR